MSDDTVQVPAYNEELEQAVLGALLRGGAMADIAEVLAPDDFYRGAHQCIFDTLRTLDRLNEPLDPLMLAAQLEQRGRLAEVGGRAYLAELAIGVASAVNLVSHAKAVRELSILRGLRRVGRALMDGVDGGRQSAEVAHDAERQLFAAVWARQVRAWRPCAEVVVEALEQLDIAQRRRQALLGTTTGLRALDAYLSGWQRTDLIVVAGRTSMGKTAFGVGAALAAAKAGAAVAFVSLEMGARQLGVRLLAHEARADVFQVMSGRLDAATDRRVRETAVRLGRLPLGCDDGALLTMDELRAKARQLRVKDRLDLLIVDYLQLMQAPRRRDSRQVEVSDISRGLKLLAKELDISVLALSQVSRECERREDKRPILADLRESGAIEQDADVVLMLYRDEVYEAESPDRGVAEILIRKHRNGPIGDVRAAFLAEQARFADLTEAAT